MAVASFPAGSECVAAVAGCACFERGCCSACAVVGFVLGLRIHVGVSRRLREPTCGVAFTGAGLWSMEPVEGVLALLAVPLLWVGVDRAKQMLVCRVAPLVKQCDTCLWLLPALGWLVVNFGKVFPEFFSAGSGRSEFEVSIVWLVVVALPSRLRCIAWLPCVLVRFPRIVGCCPGENGALVVLVEVLPEPVVLLPLIRWLASFLTPYGLCQMVVWAVGAVFSHCGDLCGEGPYPCAFLRLSWLLPSCVWFPCGAIGVELSTSGTPCAGRCLVAIPLLLWGGYFALSSLGPFEVDVLSLTSVVVTFPVQVVDILSCLALLTSDVFLRFASARLLAVAKLCVAIQRSLVDDLLAFSSVAVSTWDLYLAVVFLVSLVRVVPVQLVMVVNTGKSWCDLAFRLSVVCGMTGLVATEVPVATVIPIATAFAAWQTDLLGFCGTQGGCILVTVWAAVVIRFVSRRPAPSRSGGQRLKALAGFPFPFLLPPLLSEGESFPLSDGWSLVASATRVELGSGVVEQGGGGHGVVKAPFVVVATPGCSIPAVRLPPVVATAEHVVTSEKASPRSDATLSRHALADGPSGGLQKGYRACLCLLGLSRLQASCAISVEGVAPGGGRDQVTDLEQKGKTVGTAA
ncbi:hypothetical protein Taro_043417 [Colocasia esculenta]|uniref:Uncharacterized protein n=1 Tax=Colocasia esculenta TaxID=4460 RepID=A0A843X0N9_COLES|nr:hypothetical protein [Colocasia esculenta]